MTMIKQIALKNFKAFESVSVECSNLNILTGYNDTGKSSLWKALCLLRQSFLHNGKRNNFGLYIKGPLVKETFFGLYYHNNDNKDANPLSIQVDWDDGLQYIGDFKSPQDCVDVENWTDIMPYDSPPSISGPQPEFAAEWFCEKELFNKHEFKFFNAQREFISFPFVAEYRPPQPMAKFNKRLDIHIQSMFPNIGDNYWFDTEAGLGLKNALPIVKALLSSCEGELIIIENPETYLHPHAQAEMGRLMAVVAAQGVQLFVETQSEYLLNAIRSEIKKENIHHQQVNVLFFDQKKNIQNIPIDKDGKNMNGKELNTFLAIGFEVERC